VIEKMLDTKEKQICICFAPSIQLGDTYLSNDIKKLKVTLSIIHVVSS
jgi:hypothetical protein